jgi:acyl-CoA reductase-like NAD-dependent aldehyde dehydrogenase
MQFQERDSLYVDGTWTRPHSTTTITARSASTEEEIGRVPEADEADIDAAVDAARRAFGKPDGWPQWAPAERRDVLYRFADELEKRAEQTANLVSSQNGMPIQVARQFEGGFPAFAMRYYGDLVRQGLEEERAGLFGGRTLVLREPVGVAAAIVPWNFPQGLTASKIAPALAAGCTVVLKPAPETVLDAFVLAEAAMAAGLPAGVLNIVPAGREVGEYLVTHPGVDKVSFTGSTAAGRRLAELCGRLLRPITLELGGKSAAIVLDDADLAGAAPAFVNATLLNSGQTCMLSTRILAPQSRYDEVLDFLSSTVRSLTVGDSLDPQTQLGPLVSERQRNRVESYIAKGRSEGARLVTGGDRPGHLDRGYFVSPTVFADVDNNSTIAQEEIFGPVLSVIPYATEDDAVRLANDSMYGLGGSVWSADTDRATAVARRVRTGSIGVNSYVNDPGSPFGGVKASGMGREMGPEALDAYLEYKSVYLPDRATGGPS